MPTRVERGCGLRLMRQLKVSDPAPFLSFKLEGAQGSRCPPIRREDDMWWPDPELSISVRPHAEAVTSYREWILHLTPEGPRLRSLWSSTIWKPRQLRRQTACPRSGTSTPGPGGEAQRRFPHRFAQTPGSLRDRRSSEEGSFVCRWRHPPIQGSFRVGPRHLLVVGLESAIRGAGGPSE